MTEENRKIYNRLINGSSPQYQEKESDYDEYFRTHPAEVYSESNRSEHGTGGGKSFEPMTKEVYEQKKADLLPKKREAEVENFKNWFNKLTAGRGINGGEKKYNDATIKHAKSKAKKDALIDQNTALEKAREAEREKKEIEALKDKSFQSVVDKVYQDKETYDKLQKSLEVSRKSGLGQNKALEDETQARYLQYKTGHDELKKQGYDVPKLLDVYSAIANSKSQAIEDEKTRAFTEKRPVTANVLSVGANVATGIMGAPKIAGNWLQEKITGEPNSLDVNAPAFMAANFKNEVRGKTSDIIKENVENETARNITTLFYQAGMSVGDFLSVSWLPPSASLAIMGMTAATDAGLEVAKNGGTTSQVASTALFAGLAEAVFEKFSLDNFNAFKVGGKAGGVNKVLDILKQMGVEGSEEVATDIANEIADGLINGGISNRSRVIAQYLANGMTQEEADKKASTDFGKQLATSFAGGALSGGLVGSVGTAIGMNNTTNTGKSILSEDGSVDIVKNMAERATSYGKDTEAYRLATEMVKKMSVSEDNTYIKNDLLKGREVGNLYNAVQRDGTQLLKSDAIKDYKAELMNNGTEEKVANKNAQYLTKANQGEKLSIKEATSIFKDKASTALFQEIITPSDTEQTVYTPTIRQIRKESGKGEIANNTLSPYYGSQGKISVTTEPDNDRSISQFNQNRIPDDLMAQATALVKGETPLAMNVPTQDDSVSKSAVYNVNGESVTIGGISAVENGNVIINTSNNQGEVIKANVNDVSFTSPAMKQVYQNASTMPTSVAKGYVTNYTTNIQSGGTADVKLYSIAFNAYRRAGRAQIPFDVVKRDTIFIENGNKNKVAELPMRIAYALGESERETERKSITKVESKMEATSKKGTPLKVAKGMHYATGVTYAQSGKLSDMQEAQAALLNALGKSANVSIVIVDEIETNGSLGAYDRSSNTVFISKKHAGEAFNYVASHELVHHIRATNVDGYQSLEEVILEYLQQDEKYDLDRRILEIQDSYKAIGQQLTKAEAIEEIVAESCFDVLSNEDSARKLTGKDTTLVQELVTWLKQFISKLKEIAKSMGRNRPEYRALNDNIEALEAIRSAFISALNTTKNTDTKSGDEAKYMINPNFNNEYDNWNKHLSNIIFEVEKTSDALKKIGVRDATIKWDSKKIIKIRNKHNGMTDNVIKQVPSILEHPVIVLQSLQSDSRITMFGDVLDNNGKPVLAVLELMPTDNDGIVLDEIKIASAYGKDNSQSVINRSRILYIETDEKKTNAWLSLNQLQLPSAITKFGLINRISYKNKSVNSHSMQNEKKDTRYMINPDFNKEYDNWDKRNAHVSFAIGRTSVALKKLGIKEKEIVWDSSKIVKTKAKHKGMTDDIIKQVPHILENPIIIMNSLNRETRLTMFGEVYDKYGKPVLAVLELQPTTANKISVDEIKLASTYGKDNPQSLIDRSKILYVDPDKKRTDNWLSRNRLQLPVDEKHLGSINRISYKNKSVNSHSMQNNEKDTQKFMLPVSDSPNTDRELYQKYTQLKRNNKALQQQIELLKMETKLTQGHVMQQKSVDKLSDTILKKYFSSYDKDTLSAEIKDVFEYIANDREANFDNMIYQLGKISKKVLEESSDLNKDIWNETKELRDYFRTTPISISEEQKMELEYYYDSYDAFKKSMFGRMNISNNGMKLEQIWSEICDTNGGYLLKKDTNELEMPVAIKEFFEYIQPRYENSYEMDMNGSSVMLALELYDAFFEVPEVHTFADKKKVELHTLKSKYRQNLQKVKSEARESYFKRLESARTEIRTVEKEKRSKLTEKKIEALSKQKAYYIESRKNDRERRGKTAIKNKILSVRKRLVDMLKQNTEKKHVPQELIRTTVDILEAVNMNTMEDIDERLEKLKVELGKTDSVEKVNEIIAKMDGLKKRNASLQSKLSDVSSFYESLKDSEDYENQNMYDEMIHDDIKDLRETIGETAINKLSLKQLEMVYTTFKEVEYTIRNANRLFKEGQQATVEEYGYRVIGELKKKKDGARFSLKKEESAIVNTVYKFAWSLLKPVYVFERIASDTLTEMYEGVSRHEGTYSNDIKEARSFAQNMYRKYNCSKWDVDEVHTLTTHKGEQLELTTDEMASILYSFLRDHEKGHIESGGFLKKKEIAIPLDEKGGQIKQELDKHKTKKDPQPHQINGYDIRNIENLLTDDQKGFYKEMQAYLASENGKKGNEVSLKMYGIKMFTDSKYFPFRSSKAYLAFNAEKTGEHNIKNMSMTKKRAKNANNPIVIEDFTDVWARSCNDMAMYHAFALPINEFNKVYNFKTRVKEEVYSTSIQMELERVYNTDANDYIRRLLKDINGGVKSQESSALQNELFSLFKKSAVFASASVAIQQPVSIIRASVYVDPKYLVMGVKDKHDWEELKKYAPIAIIKEMGYFDANIGRQATSWIIESPYDSRKDKFDAFFKDSSYRDDVLSWLPAKADEVTWCVIWNAIQRETQDKHGLKVGTEENKMKSGERFEKVIKLTQVYDSVFSRSQIMRNQDGLSKMTTAFMSEPTVTLNMLVDALMKAKRDGKEGKKHFAKVIASFIVSSVVLSMIKSIVTAPRDDDEEKTYLEKYVNAVSSNIMSELFLPNLIPIVKDIVSVAQGYDIERADMSILTDTYDSVRKICDGEKTLSTKMQEIATVIGVFTGIPVKNILRDMNAVVNVVNGSMSDVENTAEKLKYSALKGISAKSYTAKNNYKRLYEAKAKGDEKKYKEVYGWLISEGKKDANISAGLRAAMGKYDKRVEEAAQKRVDKDFEEYASLVKQIEATGFSHNDVIRAVDNVFIQLKEDGAPEKNSTIAEEAEEPTKEKEKSLFTYDELNGAIEEGDRNAVSEIVKDMVSASVKNGKTTKEAKSAIKSELTSYWKVEYIGSNANARSDIRQKLLATGVYESMTELDKTLERWRKK